MLAQPTFIKIKRFKHLNPSSRHSLEIRPSEESRIRSQNQPVVIKSRLKVSQFRYKAISSKSPPKTSRSKLSGLNSSTCHTKYNLSMYNSPKTSRTSRSRVKQARVPNSILSFPLTPIEAIEHYKDFLSEAEQSEIFEYNEIWFIAVGLDRANAKLLNPNKDPQDYKVIIGDHIQFRYEILLILGIGSFGQVCKCLDHRTKEFVALKIIKNKKRFHKQGLVEVKLLQCMKENDPRDQYNIVTIKSSFVFRGHLCIIFELLSVNLYDVIKANNFKGIRKNLIARIAVQILIGLQYIRSLSIIHCDLKPENILLKSLNKSGVKIIDFGSGCFANEAIYTYVQSRFYRAPEIMLGIPYTCNIDMWSFGCILVELHTGYPLFPGRDESDQFLRILELLGLPSEDFLLKGTRRSVFFDSCNRPRIVPNATRKLRLPGTKRLEDVLNSSDKCFIDFLKKTLTWSPEERMTPSEALDHPWVSKGLETFKQRKRRNFKSLIIDIDNMAST